MGYYTEHKLSILKDPNNKEEIIMETIEGDDDFYGLSSGLDVWNSETKSYNLSDSILSLSTTFPMVVFRLEGSGEENNDNWVCYYRDGKKQYCKGVITYDDFNEDKLI